LTHPKQVRADEVHGNHIIEWRNNKWRVMSIDRLEGRSGRHRRQTATDRLYGQGRHGILLNVHRLDGWMEPNVLHYWHDEMVTVVGWSLGS
jgi:hypothetical protein